MKNKEQKEEILSIPFVEKIRKEANRTIAEEMKDMGWNESQYEVSVGQIRHIINAYKLLREKGVK